MSDDIVKEMIRLMYALPPQERITLRVNKSFTNTPEKLQALVEWCADNDCTVIGLDSISPDSPPTSPASTGLLPRREIRPDGEPIS